eukprot:g79817.t1
MLPTILNLTSVELAKDPTPRSKKTYKSQRTFSRDILYSEVGLELDRADLKTVKLSEYLEVGLGLRCPDLTPMVAAGPAAALQRLVHRATRQAQPAPRRRHRLEDHSSLHTHQLTLDAVRHEPQDGRSQTTRAAATDDHKHRCEPARNNQSGRGGYGT